MMEPFHAATTVLLRDKSLEQSKRVLVQLDVEQDFQVVEQNRFFAATIRNLLKKTGNAQGPLAPVHVQHPA